MHDSYIFWYIILTLCQLCLTTVIDAHVAADTEKFKYAIEHLFIEEAHDILYKLPAGTLFCNETNCQSLFEYSKDAYVDYVLKVQNRGQFEMVGMMEVIYTVFQLGLILYLSTNQKLCIALLFARILIATAMLGKKIEQSENLSLATREKVKLFERFVLEVGIYTKYSHT